MVPREPLQRESAHQNGTQPEQDALATRARCEALTVMHE